MKLRAYIYHKRAEKYSDCQDCFEISPDSNRIAISDGMSQSIFPQWWAKILVGAYLKKGAAPRGSDISIYQKVWQEMVNDEISKREALRKSAWRLKDKVAEKSGAGATLCGLTRSNDDWTCECLGDSCLIAVNSDYEMEIFTSQEGTFDNHPDYYDSFRDGKGEVKSFSGKFKDSMMLLLVTDPFSELFQHHMKDREFIKGCIEDIDRLSNHQSFVKLVELWRDTYKMHDDDSTLIVLNGFDDSKIERIHIDDLTNLCKGESSTVSENANRPLITKEIVLIKRPNENIDSESMTEESVDVDAELIDALKAWLRHYKGKLKIKKINKDLRRLVLPLINK